MNKKDFNTNFYIYLTLLGITITLGVFFVYSSLFAVSFLKNINPLNRLYLHIFSLAIGTGGAILMFTQTASLIKSKFFMWLMYFGLIFLLVFVLIQRPIAGIHRWIILGPVLLQPSELAKFVIPLFIAFFYENYKEKKDPFFQLLIPLILCGLPIILIFLGPDLSSTVIISVVSFASIALSLRNKHQFVLLIFLVILSLFIAFLYKDSLLNNYQKERLVNIDNYQTTQSLKAIRSGGALGTAPFAGTLKYNVPESYSDFIIAVIGEEWGKIGIFMVLTLFFFNSYELVKMAYITGDLKTFVFCSATALWIFIQVSINALVGLGVSFVPVTGVTLPLMSYGNSSLIITLFSIGTALGLIKSNVNFSENNKDEL